MIAALLLAACTPEPTPALPVDRPEAPTPLPLPDLEGIDFEVAFRDALQLALDVDARTVFGSHRRALQSFAPGCPEVYVGVPPDDLASIDGVDDDAPGATWYDQCVQPSGQFFSGFGYWEGRVSVDGDPDTEVGQTLDAERRLVGDGATGIGDETVFEFDGDASDSLSLVTATDYQRWNYTSLVRGTATGSDPFPEGALAPDGWRTDLYLARSGGAIQRLEARGNVYLFTGRMQGRFDSLALDIDLIGEAGAGPDDCTAEPLGWIGLRDEDAVWYDLVFLPRYAWDVTGQPYPNDPLQECDGCGTLYVRGVEQGPICPDLSGLLDLPPPSVESFVLSLRELPNGGAP